MNIKVLDLQMLSGEASVWTLWPGAQVGGIVASVDLLTSGDQPG